jgi:hypothetical protein
MAAQREASGQRWAAPPGDAALGFSPTGEHTSPRREHPQLGDAKHNPGRYDLRRQRARRLTFGATLIRLPLDHHRTSEKNCSNNPRNSSGGPSLPSLMTGVAR